MISSFLIHYTKLSTRLPNALHALSAVGLTPEVITCWDGDNLMNTQKDYVFSDAAWLMRIRTIAPILLANAGSTSVLKNKTISDVTSTSEAVQLLPDWMHPRALGCGEISVLLKHYHALSKIAQGNKNYGLIAEDDILLGSRSAELFTVSSKGFASCSGDYLDLAGGCGLRIRNKNSKDNISRVSPPNTRTNACYIVSRDLARLLVENYFPFIHPIDWHLLYLLNILNVDRCYWTVEEVFIHGSECGAYSSWRG